MTADSVSCPTPTPHTTTGPVFVNTRGTLLRPPRNSPGFWNEIHTPCLDLQHQWGPVPACPLSLPSAPCWSPAPPLTAQDRWALPHPCWPASCPRLRCPEATSQASSPTPQPCPGGDDHSAQKALWPLSWVPFLGVGTFLQAWPHCTHTGTVHRRASLHGFADGVGLNLSCKVCSLPLDRSACLWA